ncbi:hypothetical protein WA026_015733 [Henosepilachna vigintioctopunctata]|uniref:C2H2-type domain-containing protein n=1 Tax=Henosepilachna vigintioctopunctata TaxID=420089 RepID=A0AAW1UYI4_9CUCU
MKCQDCNLQYIGHTLRSLKSSLTSHKSEKHKKSDIKKESCALVEHCISNNHTINLNSVKSQMVRNGTKREFLEMVRIQQNENTMNSKTNMRELELALLF